MLKFLLGRSGSGKTKYIINEIEKRVGEGKQTYLLVPEQQVYISECMLADLPASSTLCFEVISFSRLCELVFSRLGGLADRGAGKGTRNLIMWQTLRELSPTLMQYKGTKVDSSFTEIMLSLVDELHANGISPKECEAISEKCNGGELGAKLSDVGAVYADFMRNIEERLGQAASDSENKLSRLASLLKKCEIFKDAAIFVDSFTSFTAEEHEVLERLIECSESVTISFTYERGSRAPHMESISNTVKRLTRFVNENELAHEDIVLDKYTRSGKSELAILEENLWNFSITDKNRPSIEEAERGSIEMTISANEYDEIWLAGLNILKERERGVKFSEMALIARDPESRKGIIDAVFEELGIPYFISERTDLSATAPARLILSALRCIAHNFNSSDVLTLYKTGLLGIDARDADLFEDYVRTWKINGKTFLESAWSMNPDGYTTEISRRGQAILEAANRVREAIIPPLSKLKSQFSINKGNTLENCRAIYTYLEQIKLSENLSAYAESALAAGDTRGAGEMLRLYDYIVSALTDIATVLGDTEMNAEELASAIEIMLKNTDIGSIPAMSEYVTIGSGATLRVENIKTALLVGLCEGEFPANYSDSGILTENDKKKMEELGLSLTSREASVTSDELFYVYRAMAKPEEKLYLSTCRQSVSGRAQNPSSAWNRVCFLFPYIEPKYFDFGFIRGLAENQEKEIITEADTLANDDTSEINIDPFYVRMLFGNKLTLSQTKISSFAECPYKYWCENVLSLREQSESAVSYNSAGTIVHYILEKLISSLNTEDGKLREISDDELVSTVNELLHSYIGGINCPLPPSMMHSFSRLRDLALIMAKSVIEEFRSSQYRIVAYEKRISDKVPGALKPMEIVVDGIENPPTVTLGGIVDRIDLYEGEDKNYLRVVDYKTGIHRFDVDKISNGTDLQLPAYLFTATLEANKGFFADDKELVPSSALFLSAEEGEGKITARRSGFLLSDEELLRAASPEMDPEILAGIKQKKDGTLSGKAALEYDNLMEIDTVMRKTISDTARGMYSGKAPRTPSESACKFCKMKSTCPVAHKS